MDGGRDKRSNGGCGLTGVAVRRTESRGESESGSQGCHVVEKAAVPSMVGGETLLEQKRFEDSGSRARLIDVADLRTGGTGANDE